MKLANVLIMGKKHRFLHNKANRMTTLADKTQKYDKAGNLTLAYSTDRGISYKYAYDHNNRLIEIEDIATTNRKAAFTLDMRRAAPDGRGATWARKASRACQGFTYDALGRRIEVTCSLCRAAVSRVNDTLSQTVHYYYDGVNETCPSHKPSGLCKGSSRPTNRPTTCAMEPALYVLGTECQGCQGSTASATSMSG